jgi:Domain of unknown function (DUF4132)
MSTAVKIGIDGFPIDPQHLYAEQHLAIDPIIEQAFSTSHRFEIKVHQYPPTQLLLRQDCKFQLKTIFVIFERLNWLDKIAFPKSHSEIQLGKSVTALSQLLDKLIARDLGYEEIDLVGILHWCIKAYYQEMPYLINYGLKLPISRILHQVEKHGESHALSEEFKSLVRKSSFLDGMSDNANRILISQLKTIDFSKLFELGIGEIWAETAVEQLNSLTITEKENWSKLLIHASIATQAAPTSKWLITAKSLLENVGIANFSRCVSGWFILVQGAPGLQIAERNRLIVTGLIWFYSLIGDEIEIEIIADLTVRCYQKIPGIGPVCLKAGNAGLWLLGEIGTFQAINCMEKMRQKIKNQTIIKQLEKHLNQAAQKTGLSREDLEELSIPTYGLDLNGTLQHTLGSTTASIKILGTQKIELSWSNNGKPQKSVPIEVKNNFAGELKILKRTVDDIKKTLSVQRDRLDQLYFSPRSWNFATWHDRYLTHPVLSHLTRRLIWNLEADGKTRTGIWINGEMIDSNGAVIGDIGDRTQVTLWHPINSTVEEVLSWRLWLEHQEIVQPFKQAHREIYLLTDAELATHHYSNRFAAHIIRQHQFANLCRQRGWNYSLIGDFDGFSIPTCDLPQWDFKVEFWVDTTSSELSESYIYLYLSTDQVRFCDRVSREPRDLASIPALIFSEVMRTIDLFVGVCSIGNDPNWMNGGNINFNNYWENHSFGELGTSSQLRREVLTRLIPKLKIKDCCSISDRFLIVHGKLNNYHIHLGSGNIMIEPGSRYLCIVPDRLKTDTDRLLLPFEGDSLLSIILSKAFLLANDQTITDPSIVSQIKIS